MSLKSRYTVPQLNYCTHSYFLCTITHIYIEIVSNFKFTPKSKLSLHYILLCIMETEEKQ